MSHSCTLLLEQWSLLILLHHEFGRLDSDILCTIVCLIDPNKMISQLEHVISKADHNKLCMPANTINLRQHEPILQQEMHSIAGAYFVCSLT